MLCRAVRYFSAGLVALALVSWSPQARAAGVVISQVYGGGGNTGAPYHNDYIEIFNATANTVSLAGWSVQYAATQGSSWQKTNLSGSIAPGQYYLVQEAAGTGGGLSLPTPDAVGTIAMSATAGKVALVNTQTLIVSGTVCPTDASIVDFVGFGTGTNCFEGSGPTPSTSNTLAVFRAANGCTDTNNNASDFSAATPAPRNTATALNPCTTNPTGVGAASPSTVLQGGVTLLTVAVTPGTGPTSTGLAVTANLGAIGGSTTQTFYDDGTNGDVTAGDNTFSYSATVDAGTTPGVKSLPASITDAQSRSGSCNIGLTVTATSTSPSGTGAASPSTVLQGGTTLLTVAVTPGANPTSTGLAVSADLGAIGGSATQTFYDDGTNGDVTAGDNTFSFFATVDAGTTPGVKSLPASITDAESRSGSANIGLTVTAPTPPSGVGAASPSTVVQGGTTLLTVAVTPGANPTSTGITVSANLGAIGGSTTQTFYDDATNGDVTAGDNTFSFFATVDAGTAPGPKSLPVSIADAQSRLGSASIGLTVSPGTTSPSGTGTAAPAIVPPGAITLLSVAVTPGTSPTSTGIAVSVDLGLIGGSATQTFYDDGTHGDVTAGDNTFTFSATVDPGTTGGIKSLPATITDAQSRSASASISLTVSGSIGAFRIVDYNILNYPGSTGATRDPKYRTILGPLAADVLVTEEMNSQAGVTEFLNNVLNALEPGQWSAATFIDGNDTDAALFWKPSKVDFLGQWAFYPNPANQLRLIHVYRIRPTGYSSDGAEIRLYACHLKASDGSVERAQRLAEAAGLRDSMNAMPPGTHAMALGDLNFYRASDEVAYAKLQEAQSSDIGRVYDPLGAADWHNNPDPAITVIDTQSPCGGSGGCIGGAANGGMDDRFDFFLPTLNLGDGSGLDVIPGSYVAVGNDGQHFNLGIADPPTIPEGAAYASALVGASDHIPIRIDLQRPAKLTASGQPLAFPTVITGAPSPQLDLTVGNPATPPAATLHYSFSASGNYVVPSGSFALGAGAPNATHTFFESTANPGSLTGSSTLTSDAPDNPSTPIGLSGTVLRHAVSSLDSITVVAAGSIDFGQHLIGEFTDQSVRLHDQGYDALQAQLSLYTAEITGGDGRFSISGGFTPALIGGIGNTYAVHFDDTDAAQNTYTATLTFHTKDEPLPGEAPAADLVVQLQAEVLGGTTGIVEESLPTRTRLLSPFPNPLNGGTNLRFELSRAAEVHLDILDLSGRRIATITSGAMKPGRYSYRWNGRSSGSAPVTAGVYFVRLSGTGIPAQTARLAVLGSGR